MEHGCHWGDNVSHGENRNVESVGTMVGRRIKESGVEHLTSTEIHYADGADMISPLEIFALHTPP